MGRALSRRLGLGFAVALLIQATVAKAGGPSELDEAETVVLTYRAPAGCPSERDFVSAVTARTQRAKFVPSAPDARRFVVEIQRTPSGTFSGSLVVEENAHRARRAIASTRCEEIVEAFVFFTAITLDPSASLGSTTDGEAPPSPAQEAPAEPPPIAPPPPAALAPLPPRAPAPPRSHSEWHLSAGSGISIATGIAESAMVSASPTIDLSSSATGLSPAFSASLVWANSAPQDVPPGRFTLGLRSAVVSACALHLRAFRAAGASAPSVRLCALFEAGVLQVRPFGFTEPTSHDHPWLAAGPLVRIDVPILPGRHELAVRGDVGLAFPFTHVDAHPLGGPTVEIAKGAGVRVVIEVLLRAF